MAEDGTAAADRDLPLSKEKISDNNPIAFPSLAGVPARAARQIRQHVKRMTANPKEFAEYAKKAIITHALVLDWRARNSADIGEVKMAAESFLKIAGAVTQPPRRK